MEMYTLPDFKLSYIVRGLAQGLRVLVDSLEAAPTPVSQAESGTTFLLLNCCVCIIFEQFLCIIYLDLDIFGDRPWCRPFSSRAPCCWSWTP